MGAGAGSERRRVYVPHALGADEFLRATWHPGRAVVVVSHWRGAECVAATPVRVDDLAELADLIGAAAASDDRVTWPAPLPAELVVPADGFTVTADKRTA